jgi:DNA-binding transcriptional regulator YhcF (GntR family)
MKLTIRDLSTSGPIYQQVKNEIELLIQNNTLKSGDAMPRAGEIAKENNISEAEVVRAYHELVINGTLTKVNKKNLFGEPMVVHTVK